MKVDQAVTVKVLGLDVEQRRMALSLKQALQGPVPTDEDEDEDEDLEASPTPAKKRTVPLRGGTGGGGGFELPKRD